MKPFSDPNQTSLVDRSLDAVWHPCTQMKHHESLPLIAITKGKGAWLTPKPQNPLDTKLRIQLFFLILIINLK